MLLYIHIPFCHRICPYCSFYKHTPGSTQISTFVDALALEAKHRLPLTEKSPRTLYFGGGTPSMLSPNHLQRLFSPLQSLIDFSRLDEISFEANPATFNAQKARLFRELGITRVSLGIQSFAPHVLETLGREHTPAEAEESVHILREARIPEINIDLMFSVPGQSLTDWEETLQRAVSLEPDHLSCYNLTYEEDTAFFESLRRGEVRTSEDADARFFHFADEFLTSQGFEHYETSNFAKPNRKSSHNTGYWDGEDYLGLGPSAVSTLDGKRWKNLSDTTLYINQVQSLGHALESAESLSPEAQRLERIALGLRTNRGISLDLLDADAQQRAAALCAEGLAELRDNNLILINQGRALVDPIAAELI